MMAAWEVVKLAKKKVAKTLIAKQEVFKGLGGHIVSPTDWEWQEVVYIVCPRGGIAARNNCQTR